MLENKIIDSIEPEMLEDLNEEALRGLDAWFEMQSKITGMSTEVQFVTDEQKRPLLVVGAFRPTLMSSYLEIWVLATKNLQPRHLREGLRKFREWRKNEPRKLYARCRNPAASRFAEFFGFRHVGEEDGVQIYEA